MRRLGRRGGMDTPKRLRHGLTEQFCKIKPAETLESGRQLPDFTILYGMGQQRIDQTLQRETDNQQAILKEQAMQVELLRQLIPSNIAKWTM